MYYRIAIQQEADRSDQLQGWKWRSTVLSSLESLFLWLRLYGTLPQDRLRVFTSASRERLDEQLRQENQELGCYSVTAAQFLQKRLIRCPEGRQATIKRGAREQQATATIAVSSHACVEKSSSRVQGAGEWSMSSLESRRIQQELGSGGDHDVHYSFVPSTSLPLVLAWMRLLARVQRGELQP